jgi:hypothetical protein
MRKVRAADPKGEERPFARPPGPLAGPSGSDGRLGEECPRQGSTRLPAAPLPQKPGHNGNKAARKVTAVEGKECHRPPAGRDDGDHGQVLDESGCDDPLRLRKSFEICADDSIYCNPPLQPVTLKHSLFSTAAPLLRRCDADVCQVQLERRKQALSDCGSYSARTSLRCEVELADGLVETHRERIQLDLVLENSRSSAPCPRTGRAGRGALLGCVPVRLRPNCGAFEPALDCLVELHQCGTDFPWHPDPEHPYHRPPPTQSHGHPSATSDDGNPRRPRPSRLVSGHHARSPITADAAV